MDYFTTELHTTDLQVNRGPTLGGALKPYEIVTLISDDWFTPLRSGPVKTSKSADQMHVELASIFSAGLNTCLAITFAHDGSLEENTLKLVDLAGDWLKQRRQWLAGATDYNDVGILLGSPAEDVLDWPGGGLFGGTRVNAGSGNSYDTELLNLERSLRRAGYLPTRLIEAPPNRSYDAIPKGMRAIIVPDRAQLTPRDREMVEAFVRAGGVVLGLGRGGMLSRTAGEEAGQPAALFGVRGGGYGAVNYQVLAAAKETALTGAALHMHPDSAETLIWAYESRVGSFPFLTSNAIGAGKAFLAAASEASLGPQAPLLQELWKAVIGQPSYRLMDHPERYTVRLRRASGKTILHVIDTPDAQEGPMNRYRPLYTRLALNAKTCAFTRATIMPDGRPVEVRREGDWLVMELFPDPELTIVLE